MWNDIANISAIATLILFVFYFLGRLWCIRVEKKDLYEKIVVRGVDSKWQQEPQIILFLISL